MKRIRFKSYTAVKTPVPYTTQDFLNQFCWGLPIWSSDENFRKTYGRIADLLAESTKDSELITDQDHERLSIAIRQLDFTKPEYNAFARPLRSIVNSLLDAEDEVEATDGVAKTAVHA